MPQRQQARDSGVSNSGGGHSTELGGSWCKGVGENGPQAERTGLMAELTTLRYVACNVDVCVCVCVYVSAA